jgi:hypothetical protein
MKTVSITFEVTEEKTVVTTAVDSVDITGTDMEKDLTALLRKIRDYKLGNEIIKAIDLSTWQTS